ALQHRASAWIARLQAAGAGGLHPTIRAGGPATPTSDAARAGATTIIALTIKLDPSVGADQVRYPDYAALYAENERLRKALEEIANLSERPYDKFPSDWRDQIAACPECQRYKDHPIQRGICDDHRKPLYDRDDHYKSEKSVLGYRAKSIAREALAALEALSADKEASAK